MSMRSWTEAIGCACAAALGILGGGASAQAPQAGAPSVVVGGSADVSIGGLPTARAADPTASGGRIEQGSSNVFINGRPAGRLGDRAGCGVVVRGAGNVYVNGLPAARVGDATSGC